ncbi:MAG: hypothetical protein Q8L27_04630 [archaeon]|nr:hypothetical protein [archaeon]
MKIERKKKFREFKIHHNRVLFWIIIVLLAFLIWMLIYIRNNPSEVEIISNLTCSSDSDCVPASCCHPNSCINKVNALNCVGIKCSMECSLNTLDCGQGSCSCVNGKCSAEIK